ncbi:MAG TPA: hypothetical protein VGH42_04535 [Verrucomicrobiae bacterium]
MSLKKMNSYRGGMLLAVLLLALCGNGCCVGTVTKVRNNTGKEISLSVINAGQIPALPVTIPAGSSRICSGVMMDTSWVVSDGKSKFVFNDVSPIGTMRGKSRTESRFTSMFPCNRITQHVEVETNMAIYAVGGVGQEIPQPPGFAIQCTSTNSATNFKEQPWIAFASSRHAGDLLLLKKKLQSEHIHCSDGKSQRFTDSLLVDSKDFMRARTVAITIITANSLTVNLEVDANSNGYELWENGKKIGENYF